MMTRKSLYIKIDAKAKYGVNTLHFCLRYDIF